MASKATMMEINWAACALIKARDCSATYAALVALIRIWPEAKLCKLAAKLAPSSGQARDRHAALQALQLFSQSTPQHIVARIRATTEEIARVSDVFCQ